jgi:hypothetical protein
MFAARNMMFAGAGLDPDAADYFSRIASAGSSISANNKNAVNAFIVGCKTDGIWSAIKAACFLAGPDDLTGSLVPLVGPAPTNVNFVAGDYNRTTGLLGNGSTKYLNSNRAANADPQNDNHLSAWITSITVTGNNAVIGTGGGGISGSTHIMYTMEGTTLVRNRMQDFAWVAGVPVGFVGTSRAISTQFVIRQGSSNTTFAAASQAPLSSNSSVFARDAASLFPGRLSFYSIGESLDLALLDARLTTYMAALT